MYKDGDFNIRFFGNFDISNLAKKVTVFTEDDWNEFAPRQGGAMYGEHRSPHEESRTIPLLFNEHFSDFPEECKWYQYFKEDVDQIRSMFLDHYGKGNIPRIIITKLLAERNILPHVDTGKQLLKCKRHHIPIITNGMVIFHVGEDSVNMKSGEVWEINNANLHYVRNYSTEDRIHIIVDWDINLEY